LNAPHSVGGIAFNSKGELFYSDGPRGRLWKVVNGTPELYVAKGSWSSMYGIAFDFRDNLYFCDWSNPGNIYYVDFTLSLTYRVLDGNKVPLNGAKVLANLPNGTALTLTSDSAGYISMPRAWPGAYELSVSWQDVLVGEFGFVELSSGSKDLLCTVFSLKLTAEDSLGRALSDAILDIQLPNGSNVRMASPASLPLTPAGSLSATVKHNGTQVAGPVSINLTSNLDMSIPCSVHSLSVEVRDTNMKPLENTFLEVRCKGSVILNQSSPSGKLMLDGLLDGRYTIAARFRGVRVAETDLFLNTSQTLVLMANVHSLSIEVKDASMEPLRDSFLEVRSEGSIICNESSASGMLTLDGLLDGDYVVAAKVRGFTVAKTTFFLNASRTLTLMANVSELVVVAKDVFGFPMQGANVSVTLPDGSALSGSIGENGVFSLSQLPMTNVQVSIDSGSERRDLSVDLNRAKVDVSTTFLISSTMNTTIVALTVIGVLIIPQTRHLLVRFVRAIPLEVSFEAEAEDLASLYSRFLSSTGLDVEEEKEVKGGEPKVIVGGNALPSVRSVEDHVVFLVSDKSVMPPRREIRVVKQLVDIRVDSANLSMLAYAYSQGAKLKAFGVLVCDEVTDEMLSTLKTLPGAEVVLMTKQRAGASTEFR